MKLDLSGAVTRATIRSPLTPLFLLTALAVGLMALLTISREEEPQISVPMVDLRVAAPGLAATDVVEQVSKPLEEIIKAIPDVEHVYSNSEDDGALVTARFRVGVDYDDAVVRVHEKVRANIDRIPPNVPEPQIIGRGIDDVPVLTLTLSAAPGGERVWTHSALTLVADELLSELTKVEDVGHSFIVGAKPLEMRVEPDPEGLAAYGVSLQRLAQTVQASASAFPAGQVRQDGDSPVLQAGAPVMSVADLERLQLRGAGGRPVYLSDVATVKVAGQDGDMRAWTLERETHEGDAAHAGAGEWRTAPAVTLALAKRPGANAVVVTQTILDRVENLKGSLIPDGLTVKVTRDYGATANHKANELLFHLALATVSIVLLIVFAIGRREAIVTFVVIPTTILLTLFASLMMGYTINRVSLFALIFSIGILVDDAIVIVENIARHWAMKDGRSRMAAAIDAVSEVGNPTIVATLTVISALLPMMFVSGLMGPYMAPIPANASAAMLFSFFVAVGVAPWLMVKLAGKEAAAAAAGHAAHGHDDPGPIGRLYARLAAPLLKDRRTAWTFLIAVGVATLLACSLFATTSVRVKLLPFDDKSEIQVVLDLPEGASLEDTERALFAMAAELRDVPEIETVQAYAGTAAPFNFNGLVRHYFLRDRPEQGDLQINLSEKGHRKRASHAIALDVRERIARVSLPAGASAKVAEVPPGPPVIATLLAEIYGPDAEIRRKVAREVAQLFRDTPFIVDVDDSIGQPRPRLAVTVDSPSAHDYGVHQADVLDTLAIAYGGRVVGAAPRGEGRQPLDIRIAFPREQKMWSQRLATLPVPRNLIGPQADPVELGAVVRADMTAGSPAIFRRDGRFADLVMGELAGQFEAPIYGMLEIEKRVKAHDWGDLPVPRISLYGQPADESTPTLLWDGEWEITYVTFRDMGLAFGVALVGIYVLVVAQFGSFRAPLIILTPIPLTLIGIMLGHWMLGAAFTATSMIGFIALAGIIVRNSILLVDFIKHLETSGRPLREVLIEAGAIRFKPIVLTAAAAMIGAAVILTDPIFQGLAISLLFGLASSTALTVLVIPAIYVALRGPDYVKPVSSPDGTLDAAVEPHSVTE